MISPEVLISEFKKISTGAISDSMDFLGIPSGVIVNGPKPINFDPDKARMVGFACTVQQMPKRQVNPGSVKNIDVYNSIAQPGQIVVFDAGGRMDAATTGGLQMVRAKVRGLGGVIINGCCRDADEIIKGDMPFFCKGTCPRKSVVFETVGINVPITVSNVQICPGDLIVGDATGLIVISAEVAEKVLERAQFIKRVEDEMERRLLAGEDYSGLRKRVEAELQKA